VASVGADLVRAQVLTQGITQAIKLTAGRTRPDGTSLSFPSGHTASSFATATVLHRHYGWKVGVPAYVLAGYVGTSRLSENRHYLSDVIFGATVGILAGRQVTMSFGKTKFALTPRAVPGGAGIALVKIGR
jgi:membrane-associated phospholipid phosphatase